MKITSIRITFAAVVLAAIVSWNNAYPGATVFENFRGVVQKEGGSTALPFPDVCKTPSPGGPMPIPYPNMVPKSASAFAPGKKATKDGGNILITGTTVTTNNGTEQAYKLTVTDKAGRKVALNKSKLFELTDGTFCAVCVEQGLLTRVLKLKRVK